MPRDYKLYLEDIVESIEKIKSYIIGMDLETFSDDQKTIDAVVRNLQIIGEATRKLPDKVREKDQDIEWGRIIALRNIIIHDYPAINLRIIWSIANINLPILAERIKKIIHEI